MEDAGSTSKRGSSKFRSSEDSGEDPGIGVDPRLDPGAVSTAGLRVCPQDRSRYGIQGQEWSHGFQG